MGRLDDLDLSQDLPKKEAKKRLKKAQERMQELRLELAGLDGDPRLGPPLCVVMEGWDASGKGGAIKRLVARARPAPRARQAVRGADAGRAAPPLAAPLLAGAAGLGRDGDPRPLLVRPRARRARRGLRDRGGVEARLRRDQRLREDARRRGRGAREALAAPLRRGAAGPLRGAPRGPAEGLQAHGRGLAQPRQAPGLREGDRGHARADLDRRGRRGTSSRATPSASPA